MKSILIIFTAALAIGFSFLACDPKADKIRAYTDVISTSTFEDTVITYFLSSDSLILEFEKAPKIKHWYGEILLLKSDLRDAHVIPFPNKGKDDLGRVTIEGKQLVLSGFHIPADSLDWYLIHFQAVPHIPGFRSWGEIYTMGYLFSSQFDGSNKLHVMPLIRDFKITSFDLVKLKNMSPEWRAFCRDSIEKAFHMTFTDAEIEESGYEF